MVEIVLLVLYLVLDAAEGIVNMAHVFLCQAFFSRCFRLEQIDTEDFAVGLHDITEMQMESCFVHFVTSCQDNVLLDTLLAPK